MSSRRSSKTSASGTVWSKASGAGDADEGDTFEQKIAMFRQFEQVKSNCAEIVPELLRAKNDLKTKELKQKYEILTKIMKDGKVENVEENMEFIKDFDKSETIRMNGNVSRTIYASLVGTRGFDIYGRLRTQCVLKLQEELRADEGVDLEEEINVPEVFGRGRQMLKALPLTTPAWKIDKKEKYNAPVGFSKNPIDPTHSMGNEAYFSYDGMWRDGKMEGNGTYMFVDDLKYEGEFKNNAREGQGNANYHGKNCTYEGQWRAGRFNGQGLQKLHGGGSYEGSFVVGRRDGVGVVKYGRGLYYEGEFRDGKPHGRGFMFSELTGYAFEGTFVNGRINGSGVLMTPAPEHQRIVRIWEKPTEHANADATGKKYKTKKELKDDEEILGDLGDVTADGFLLPGVVKMYLQELEAVREKEKKHREDTFGRMHAIGLNELVSKSRNMLHAGRAKKKRDLIIARLKLEEEMKAELKKARMKAYEDLLAEEATKEGAVEAMLKKFGIAPKDENAESEEDSDDSYDSDDSDEDSAPPRALKNTAEGGGSGGGGGGSGGAGGGAMVEVDGEPKKRKQAIVVRGEDGEVVRGVDPDAEVEVEEEKVEEAHTLFEEGDLPAYMRGRTNLLDK